MPPQGDAAAPTGAAPPPPRAWLEEPGAPSTSAHASRADATSAASLHKAAGNAAFGAGDLATALAEWEKGVKVLTGEEGDDDDSNTSRELLTSLHCNRSAALHRRGDHAAAAAAATAALDVDPSNTKALLRRAAASESTGNVIAAAEDAAAALAAAPTDRTAAAMSARLAPAAAAAREAAARDAVDQLKKIGGSLLGAFGLSLDDFSATKGEDGAYSIHFGRKEEGGGGQ